MSITQLTALEQAIASVPPPQEERPDGGDQFLAFFDFMPQLGWSAQPDGSIDFYNRCWYEYTGTTFEEMQGWGWEKVHDPTILPFVRERWLESLRTGMPFEMAFPLRRHDGQFRWFLTRVDAMRAGDGNIVRWIGINTDIHEHRQQVKESREELDLFFAMSVDLLCIAGLDGFFKRLNPSWSSTLGWSEAELMSKRWIDFVHPDDRQITVLAGEQLNEGSPVLAFSNRYACKDGTYRWLEWRSVPFAERGLVYAAARDVTQRREAEETAQKLHLRLVAADRMASVGTLAAGVAHEINNPLAYVMSNLDISLEEIRALAGGSSSGRMKDLEETVHEAREGVERIRKIVRGMKTFSRVDEERCAIMEVRPVLELAINMAFNEIRHRARLVKDYRPIPLVSADDARLGQVFVNLLVNAAQAIPEGKADENEIRIVSSTDAAGRAVVEVKDTGPGIPEAIRERIFAPFFTTKGAAAGTGLGLSICHNIVTGMGGEISVHSEVGQGTTFRIVLPAAEIQHLPGETTDVRPSNRERRGRVLVVDDEPSIRVALERVLRNHHHVTLVATVKEALDVLASNNHFDVILSDIMMPQMTGMDFYRELTLRFPQYAAKLVFVTGGAFTRVARDFLEGIPNERLEKPFTPKSVRDVVQKFID